MESVSWGSLSLRNVAQAGLSHDFVLGDLTVVGSLSGGGGLGPVDLVYIHELKPGDANRDFSFDQLDVVQVLQAGNYLTGQPATWGEGDWNGGPGGYPGEPPPGDGIFDQLDIVAAQHTGTHLTGAYAALAAGGVRDDDQTSLVYDADTGEMAIDVSEEFYILNIDSKSGVFTGLQPKWFSTFDNFDTHNIFVARLGPTFSSLSFGNVARPGLTRNQLIDDLTVWGLFPRECSGGFVCGFSSTAGLPPNLPLENVTPVDLIFLPEPSSIVFAVTGLVGLASIGVRRSERRHSRASTAPAREFRPIVFRSATLAGAIHLCLLFGKIDPSAAKKPTVRRPFGPVPSCTKHA